MGLVCLESWNYVHILRTQPKKRGIWGKISILTRFYYDPSQMNKGRLTTGIREKEMFDLF
jgi:hypothetical protein